MIKALQKKISTVLFFLFILIWVGVLLLYVNTTYRNNLLDLKQDINNTLREVKFKNFLKTRGTNVDFDDIKYCVYALDDERHPTILFYQYPNISEQTLQKEGERLAKNWKGHKQFLRYTYIYRFHSKQEQKIRYMILISGSAALRNTLPTIIVCSVLAVFGIFLFVSISRMITRWMVRPIEDMINGEKKFISNASHELKTPLAVISANTELLASEVGPDNKHLNYIQQETKRMISLVQKMLTLTRLDAPQVQKEHAIFPVDESLLDIIYPMESLAFEKNIQMDIDVQEHMKIDGNEDQIQNLVSILLNNALSYTPEHGTIEIHASIHNRKFYLTVANSGDPIPEEIRDKLFERFYRADEAREDNGHFGLGLSIAKSIVTSHNGKISVSYHADKNVFSVVLPTASHK